MVGRKAPEETRREDMLRAAYDVAARQGLEALTLRTVAARADVSHGTVVFHFKRKQELVAALLDRVLYATAVLRVPDAVAQITRPSERLHALCAPRWTGCRPIPDTSDFFSSTGRSAFGTPRSAARFVWLSSRIVWRSRRSPARS